MKYCSEKVPYPKTYDTAYEKLLVDRVREMMDDSHSPVMDFLDRKNWSGFLTSPSDYGKPGTASSWPVPQMLAYILQVNFWLKTYDIEVVG